MGVVIGGLIFGIVGFLFGKNEGFKSQIDLRI
jgi:hypothetical protein